MVNDQKPRPEYLECGKHGEEYEQTKKTEAGVRASIFESQCMKLDFTVNAMEHFKVGNERFCGCF